MLKTGQLFCELIFVLHQIGALQHVAQVADVGAFDQHLYASQAVERQNVAEEHEADVQQAGELPDVQRGGLAKQKLVVLQECLIEQIEADDGQCEHRHSRRMVVDWHPQRQVADDEQQEGKQKVYVEKAFARLNSNQQLKAAC